jgi:hypothetical protein
MWTVMPNFIGPHKKTVAVATLMLVKLTVRVSSLHWAFLALRGVQIGTERSRHGRFLLMPSSKYGCHCTDILETH